MVTSACTRFVIFAFGSKIYILGYSMDVEELIPPSQRTVSLSLKTVETPWCVCVCACACLCMLVCVCGKQYVIGSIMGILSGPSLGRDGSV